MRHGLREQRLAGARAGRAAGCPAARARPAPGSASDRAGTRSPRAARPSTPRHRPRRPSCTAPDEEGLISCGLVRGMRRSIQTRPKATTPRKMIGSQITAQSWISPQVRPPSVAGGKIWPTLKVSLPSSRENVWLATSRRQSAGSVPPGAASSSLERRARLVAGQVARLLDRDAVVALRQHEAGDALLAGQLDRLAALGRAALGERVRGGAQQHRERTYERRSPHLVPQSDSCGQRLSPRPRVPAAGSG